MDGDASPPTATNLAATKKSLAEEAVKKAILEKERKQKEFIKKCTIANVTVDVANPKLLKGSKDTTPLQSINGACPNLLGANALRQFMINNKLQNYQNKSKGEMCAMIAERKKNENLDEIMYGKDFGKEDDADDSEESEHEVTGGGEAVTGGGEAVTGGGEAVTGGDGKSKKKQK
jgi:hypothetical protein